MATSTQEISTTRRVTGGKFLTFFLAKEEYGIEILKVQEIIGVMAITPVPRTPDHLRGVINLRGKIIPPSVPADIDGIMICLMNRPFA